MTRLLPVLLWCLPLSAAWTPLGPFGGSAAIVVADPHSSRTFLAATSSGLLFRSRDAGGSWTPLFFPAQFEATLNTLAVDPQTPGVYMAGISGDAPRLSGMLRSTDAGATWHEVPGLRGRAVRAIAFMRANATLVAAATDTGVFLSHDGGLSWDRASPEDNPQLRPVMSLAFDSSTGSTLYAGTPHLPWKTSDGGATWRSIPSGMIDDSDIFSIAVNRNWPLRLLAGACSGIYRSVDGGLSWTRASAAKGASDRTYVVVQDPQYENFWFAGTAHGLVRSLDNGSTWRTIAPFSTHSIAFDPRRLGRILITTDNAGILRSEDNGATWAPANRGFCNRRVSSLWITAGEVYASSPDAYFHLDNAEGKWEDAPTAAEIAPPPPESAAAEPVCRNPRTGALFAGRFGVIYTSLDRGRTWTRISPPDWPISSIRQLLFIGGAQDDLLILTSQQGIWEFRP